ncbi:MAG: hypothetical protein RL177_1287, partial [Bacteroidota bacterium]
GTEGSFEILTNHAAIMSALEAGEVRVTDAESGTKTFAISGGFVEARDNEVVVLAEAAESPEQIDVARAEAAMTRAKERLSSRASDLDQARAEAALSRAMNRLKVAGAR